MAAKTGGGSSQRIDFSSGRTIHPILTTKTLGSIPTKFPFVSESLPNGNQGTLIHSIGRGQGTNGENPKEIRKKGIGSATPVEIIMTSSQT